MPVPLIEDWANRKASRGIFIELADRWVRNVVHGGDSGFGNTFEDLFNSVSGREVLEKFSPAESELADLGLGE